MENSKDALFCEPNAYITQFKNEKFDKKPIKKIIFSEPYDCMPTFHLNNDFQRGKCECLHNKKDDCKKVPQKPNFNFDIKSLLPILSGFNKSGIDVNGITSMFNPGGGFDFSKLLSNPQLITSALSMFGGKKKTSTKKEEIICTDYEIKRYTKV